MYRTLDPGQIIKTLRELEARIADRFPGSGLGKVCAELISVTIESNARIATMSKPHLLLRTGIVAVLGVGVVLLIYLASIIEIKRDAENLFGVMQGIDSVFNILVLMGAGILFLASLEARRKRQQAMEHLHELRSIIHVIDMHQLPKDPSSARPPTVATPDISAPQRQITPFELARYLDYCSEMLSLAAKVAALYAQSTKDPIVIDAASDLGQITSNLSNKIWQKITIVQSLEGRDLPLPAAPQKSFIPGAS
ncbi:MAG: hypothetical protein ABL897_09440 [Hyphomicrobium sp.]